MFAEGANGWDSRFQGVLNPISADANKPLSFINVVSKPTQEVTNGLRQQLPFSEEAILVVVGIGVNKPLEEVADFQVVHHQPDGEENNELKDTSLALLRAYRSTKLLSTQAMFVSQTESLCKKILILWSGNGPLTYMRNQLIKTEVFIYNYIPKIIEKEDEKLVKAGTADKVLALVKAGRFRFDENSAYCYIDDLNHNVQGK